MNRWLNKYGGLLAAALAVGLGVLICLLDGSILADDHRYAAARVYEVHRAADGDAWAHATFEVNGTAYWVRASAEGYPDAALVKQRFLVKFHPPDPNRCRLLLQAPVPAGVPDAPAGGWKKPPFAVPAGVVE